MRLFAWFKTAILRNICSKFRKVPGLKPETSEEEKEIYCLIGKIIDQTNLMEAIITDYICDLVDHKNAMIGGLIISSCNLNDKIGILNDLAHVRFAGQKKFLIENKKAIKYCNEIKEERNILAHRLIQPFGDNSILTYVAKHKSKPSNKKKTMRYATPFSIKSRIYVEDLVKILGKAKSNTHTLYRLKHQAKSKYLKDKKREEETIEHHNINAI